MNLLCIFYFCTIFGSSKQSEDQQANSNHEPSRKSASSRTAITSRAKNRLVAAQPHDQEPLAIRTEIVDEMFLDLTTINEDDGPVPALKLSRPCPGSFCSNTGLNLDALSAQN